MVSAGSPHVLNLLSYWGQSPGPSSLTSFSDESLLKGRKESPSRWPRFTAVSSASVTPEPGRASDRPLSQTRMGRGCSTQGAALFAETQGFSGPLPRK